jgi:hypothetical protein
MIQFIELVPVEEENPNYKEEKIVFEKDFGAPHPDQKVTRHLNQVSMFMHPWVQLQLDEVITFWGEAYTVETIGPKMFEAGTFVQQVYIKKK